MRTRKASRSLSRVLRPDASQRYARSRSGQRVGSLWLDRDECIARGEDELFGQELAHVSNKQILIA